MAWCCCCGAESEQQPWRQRIAGVVAAVVLLAAALTGCGGGDAANGPRVITMWHQVRPAEREVLRDEIARYEAEHPDVRIRALYKETEELRSGFQAAALAGTGPELVYGPSDVIDTFHTMRLIQDLSQWFSEDERNEFVDKALTYLPAKNGADQRRVDAGGRSVRQSFGAGLQPELHQVAAEDDGRTGEAGRREHAR